MDGISKMPFTFRNIFCEKPIHRQRTTSNHSYQGYFGWSVLLCRMLTVLSVQHRLRHFKNALHLRPLADSETLRHDGVIHRSILKKRHKTLKIKYLQKQSTKKQSILSKKCHRFEYKKGSILDKNL